MPGSRWKRPAGNRAGTALTVSERLPCDTISRANVDFWARPGVESHKIATAAPQRRGMGLGGGGRWIPAANSLSPDVHRFGPPGRMTDRPVRRNLSRRPDARACQESLHARNHKETLWP